MVVLKTTHDEVLAVTRSYRVRRGPSTLTNKNHGLFKNGSTSSYVFKSHVTWLVNHDLVV